MKYAASALAMAGMAATVRGHGFITSPAARMPGSAMEAACGQQVYYNQEGDNYGNVQGELQVAATQTDYDAAKCDIWLCKGFKYADNTDKVQSYTAGQTVDIKFDIRAPHTGVANVSIVNTATNSIIGSPLVSWDVFASNSNSDYGNETSFSITIPSDLGSTCSTAGACVIQHYWNAASIDQTYESCIDFTVGGSGSNSSGSSSSAVASATSSAAVSSVTANTELVSTSAAATSTSATYVSSSSTSCTTTLTISSSATSVAAVSSIVSNLASAVPSAALTSTISAVAPSGTSSMKPIPSGFTLADMLEWIDYLFEQDETTWNSTSSGSASATGVSKRQPIQFKA